MRTTSEIARRRASPSVWGVRVAAAAIATRLLGAKRLAGTFVPLHCSLATSATGGTARRSMSGIPSLRQGVRHATRTALPVAQDTQS